MSVLDDDQKRSMSPKKAIMPKDTSNFTFNRENLTATDPGIRKNSNISPTRNQNPNGTGLMTNSGRRVNSINSGHASNQEVIPASMVSSSKSVNKETQLANMLKSSQQYQKEGTAFGESDKGNLEVNEIQKKVSTAINASMEVMRKLKAKKS